MSKSSHRPVIWSGRYRIWSLTGDARTAGYEPSGKLWLGPDAVLQNLFVKLATEWDGFAVHPEEFHGAGSAVVVEGRYTGTYKQTGRKMDAQVCHVRKIRDGKIASFQQYMDTAQWQDVCGTR